MSIRNSKKYQLYKTKNDSDMKQTSKWKENMCSGYFGILSGPFLRTDLPIPQLLVISDADYSHLCSSLGIALSLRELS